MSAGEDPRGHIRRITANEASTLRALRLRALATDPLSFGSTYAREAAYTGKWEEWAREDASGSEGATFFALAEDGSAVGLVAGYREQEVPTTVHVVAMWVAPEHRRRGHARRLLEAVVSWASDSGAREARLWVTDAQARALYERCGFEPDGRRQPLPHAPHIIETGMSKRLPQTDD